MAGGSSTVDGSRVMLSLLFLLSSLLGTSLGGKECSHCVEQWRECLKQDCASSSGASLPGGGGGVLPGSCEWDCKARRRRCFDECLKDSKTDGGSRQEKRSFIIKPATMPSFEDEGDAELLVHVTSDVWAKGPFVLEVLLNSSTHVLGKVLSEDLTRLSGGSPHVDRRMRQWHSFSVPLRGLPVGATLCTAVLRGGGVAERGEVRQFHLVKAPGGRHNRPHIDHRRDTLLDINGIPMIITGMYSYGINTEQEMLVPNMEAPHGFSVILPYLPTGTFNITSLLSFLDRCYAVGLGVIVSLGTITEVHSTSNIDFAALEKRVLAVRDHPAVVGYYLADEPGGQGILPNILQESYVVVKAIDPFHPVFMVFCCSNPAEYELTFDVGATDGYPIPNSPATSIQSAVDEVAAVGKPFLTVVQSFGGGEAWERAPTPQEARVMVYISLLSGSTGFIYFVYSPRNYPYSTSLWSECRTLALEALDLSSSLLSEKPPLDVTVSDGVKGVGFETRVGTYEVLLLNTQLYPILYTVDVGMDVDYTVEVRYQGRNVNMQQGVVKDFIGPYATAILRFPPPTSSVSPANILVNPSFEEVASAATPDGAYLGLVGSDLATSYFADPRISYDALYSVRLTSPEDNNEYHSGLFPISVTGGTTYQLSAYLYAAVPGITVQFSTGPLVPLGSLSHTVRQPGTWEQFTVSLNCTQSGRGSYIGYQLVTKGTLWMDLLQLIPQK